MSLLSISISSNAGRIFIGFVFRPSVYKAVKSDPWKLENGLAQKILAGEFGPGDTVRVDAAGGELVFGS